MACRDNETIICRCEDITRERILECIAEGYGTINEIKRVKFMTRIDADLQSNADGYNKKRTR